MGYFSDDITHLQPKPNAGFAVLQNGLAPNVPLII